jgi:ribose transport system substrate-binding protein
MRDHLKWLFLATLVLSFLAGCGDNGGTTPTATAPSTGTAGPAPAPADKKLKLAFITNNSSDFWLIARAGTDKAKEEVPNIDVQFLIPDGTVGGQKRVVDDLLSAGIDGVAISPVDPKNQTELLNKIADQAVLFTQDSDAPKSNRMCYLGTNNEDAGKQAGEMIKKALPDGGKIMVFVGTLDAQNAHDRYQGIQDVIKGTKIEVIDVRTDGADHGRAKTNVRDTLVSNPDVACLVGLWSYNGPAIYDAVKDADKVGKVKIVCFDEEDMTLAGIKAGAIDATIVQQPFEFGHQSMAMLAKVIRGDKSAIPAGKQIFIPTRAITKDNVDDFSAELKKLRGK